MQCDDNALPNPNIHGEVPAKELLSVWLVDSSARFVITPHLWEDPAPWGILIADLFRHLGSAYEGIGQDYNRIVHRIKEAFDAEWNTPTSAIEHLDE